VEVYERTDSIGPAGYWRRHAGKGDQTQPREAPAVMHPDQLATRESQAGPYGVAERLVVPMKPGNSGGGKGPQLKGSARSNEGPRDWR